MILRYPYLKIIPDCLYKLRELVIYNCENVELLPHQLQNLTALTSLTVSHCENIKTPLSQWGLATLTSLKHLTIAGIFPQVASFSEGQRLPILPKTLIYLSIKDFQNLKSLSSLVLMAKFHQGDCNHREWNPDQLKRSSLILLAKDVRTVRPGTPSDD